MSAFRRVLTMTLLSVLAAGCTKDLVCNTGESACDGHCVNLSVDANNCSACGHACPAGDTCQAGLCCQGGLCPAGLYVACSASGEVQGATVNPIAPVGQAASVPNAAALAWNQGTLWAVPDYVPSAAFELGTGLTGVSQVAEVLIPPGNSPNLVAVTANGGLLYVSDDETNSVVVVSPATSTGSPGIVGDVQGLPAAFPYGIAFAGGSGYIALQNPNQIAVFDVAQEKVTTTIDLSQLGSAPGTGQPGKLLVVGERLYAALLNLEPDFLGTAGDGLLAVIDTSTNALATGVSPNPIDLGSACQDPYGLALYGNTLYVTCGFLTAAGTVAGAAIVPVDISGPAPVVQPALSTAGLTPAAFFAPGPIAFCGNLGYVGDQQFGYVLRIDPAAGPSLTASQVPLCNPGPFGSYVGLADIQCAE